MSCSRQPGAKEAQGPELPYPAFNSSTLGPSDTLGQLRGQASLTASDVFANGPDSAGHRTDPT
jgi:hypothetical protein